MKKLGPQKEGEWGREAQQFVFRNKGTKKAMKKKR
jgi:hypothetical protein